MKKFYILFLVCVLAISASFGQGEKGILILAADAEDADILAIQAAVEESSGQASEIHDPAAISDWGASIWDDYVACVMTENGGSSSHGNFGPIGIQTLPFVSLKAYAIKKTYPAWSWLTGDADQWWTQTKDSSQVNYDYTYSGVVVAEHPILGECWGVGEEFEWTTVHNENEGDEAHIQCMDIKMSYPAVADAATLVATNKFAADETGSVVDGWLWAVEANDSSQAAVVWGIHHEFLNNATETFFNILQNSLAWVMGEEIPNICVEAINDHKISDFDLRAYPNPATSSTTLEFNLNESADVYLVVRDVIGKTVYEMSGSYSAGNQTIHFDTSDLVTGIYTCQLIVDGKYQSELLMVR
ncbi:hypothetical protein ES708_15378 [subsurface metagenome]